jgi:hypothetical protein
MKQGIQTFSLAQGWIVTLTSESSSSRRIVTLDTWLLLSLLCTLETVTSSAEGRIPTTKVLDLDSLIQQVNAL